ncbi:hypothetical protein AB0I27_10385 [Streptomyces sp. NPDC050597]|uniref:hypothetical protein n=1 Tax=Streptomyces sp. NPDC050597 TaxID=3157212 RepID=UPI00342F36FD
MQVVGPVFDEVYVRRHERLFSADHVKWLGELGGSSKTAAIRDGSVFVYTYARMYGEAGAAVFGESLRAGTPIAAFTWREGTGAESALSDRTGVVTVADPAEDDETAAELLALAIEWAEDLNHTEVQEIGIHRFDPACHFTAMSTRSC